MTIKNVKTNKSFYLNDNGSDEHLDKRMQKMIFDYNNDHFDDDYRIQICPGIYIVSADDMDFLIRIEDDFDYGLTPIIVNTGIEFENGSISFYSLENGLKISVFEANILKECYFWRILKLAEQMDCSHETIFEWIMKTISLITGC